MEELTKIKVVSYNIRYDTKDDGINTFSGSREHYVGEWLSEFDADLFGFQETLPHVFDWLVKNMPDFHVLGTGREANFKGESTCIAYKKSEFELFSLETFWLSDTPFVPGSKFAADQSVCPRTCTCATLVHKKSRKLLRHYNTHLDHVGKYAKVCGASLILQKIEEDKRKLDSGFIITGDFNAFPDSSVIKTFMSYKNIKNTTESIGPTFHDYGRKQDIPQIDYILTDFKTDSAETYVIKDHSSEGIYLSDHYPVCGFIYI